MAAQSFRACDLPYALGCRAICVLALLFFAAANSTLACSVCPACRIAQACDGAAPAGGYEIAQALTDLSGGGGAAIPIQPGSWTLAILPDTQVYSQTYPQHFNAQTQWIADNAAAMNIKMVLHEGDIVNNNNVAQWNNAKAALSILDTAGVPYALAPGNHDYGPNGNASTRDTLFHNPEYFGPTTPYANQPTVGGFFEAGKTDNSYHTFSAGGEDWLVLALEFGPRDNVVAWANSVVESHPNHKAMLVTHAYMYYDETIYDWATKGSSQSWNPHSYGVANLPGGVNDGQELWDGLVKLHDNFRFTFNGHVLSDGTGYRGTQGIHGNAVHQMLANYQMKTQGGIGDMRLLEFLADGETVVVRTYSPILDRYDTAFDQQFTLNLNYVPPPPPVLYHAVGANLVAGGPTAPAANTVDSVAVVQSGSPAVGIGQINRGDYQVTVGGQRLIYTQGILLASITQHDRPDFLNRRATVEAGRNPYGDGYMSLSLMEAGVPGDLEVNFNTSAAWFAFEGGWTGAHVNGNGTLAAGAFNNVSQSQVTRTGTGRYTVNLGANAQNEGMLFVIGNNNDDVVVQTRPLAGGTTWDVRVQDSGANFSGTGEDLNWSFLYMPYDAPNLIGGYYDGIANSMIQSTGNFTMNRLATGQYELTVAGETPETGMLVLSVAHGITVGATTAPDDNILVYRPSNGRFLINSYDITGSGTTLENTKFAWAFIGFENPVSMVIPPPLVELEFTLDRTTGQVLLKNAGEGNVDITSVTILSGAGGLIPDNWKSITNNYDAAPQNGSVDPSHDWSILSATIFNLGENEPTGVGATLTPNQQIDFGDEVWNKSRIEDVMMRVVLADGTILFQSVDYINGPDGLSYHRSDLNADGSITPDDWSLFYPNMLADLSSLSGVQRALAGDLNGDGKNDFNDFVLFKADFEAAHGIGSFDSMLAGVPEPSTLVLLSISAFFGAVWLRKRSR